MPSEAAQPIATLTRERVEEAGRKAYLERRLSAQGEAPECSYRDRLGRPCIIGAALTDAQAKMADNPDLVGYDTDVRSLVKAGYFAIPSADVPRLAALQKAHDDWAYRRNLTGECRLRRMLGITSKRAA